MEIFENIKTIVTDLESDVTKFYEKGNKSAALRIRKAMQEIKKLAQDLRVDIQETKRKNEESAG